MPSTVAELTFKLEDAQRTITEKDRYIEELECQNEDLSKEMDLLRDDRAKLSDTNNALQSMRTPQPRLNQLERKIAEQKEEHRAIKAESDKYLQLLYTELRRTANEVHKREHPASGLLDKRTNVKKAMADVQANAEKHVANELYPDPSRTPEYRVEELEQEIKYHLKDIVLYKLDVKGYKKDLKRAQAKIKQLTEAAALHYPSDSLEARPSISSQSSSSTVPQLSSAGTASESEVPTPTASAGVAANGVRHIVQAWTPNVSPRASPMNTPMRERKAFVAS